MTDTEILEDIKKIISKDYAIPPEHIEEDSNLDEDLNITDLEIEDLVEKIEDKYDIQIPQEKIPSFVKVSDIVNYIYENVDTTL